MNDGGGKAVEAAIVFGQLSKNSDGRPDSIDAVKIWMAKNQFGRRNLQPFQRAELALKIEPLIAEAAKERMVAGKAADPTQNSAEGLESPKETRQVVAGMAQVSHDTIDRAKKIVAEADDQTKADLRAGTRPTAKVRTGCALSDGSNVGGRKPGPGGRVSWSNAYTPRWHDNLPDGQRFMGDRPDAVAGRWRTRILANALDSGAVLNSTTQPGVMSR